jgi:Tol biopolymer transport system component
MLNTDLRERVTRAAEGVPVEVPAPGEVLRRGRRRRRRRSLVLPAVIVVTSAGLLWGIVGLNGLVRDQSGRRSTVHPPIGGPARRIAIEVMSSTAHGGKGQGGMRLDILVVDPETGSYRNVTLDGAMYFSPAWSPDGTQLAVERVDLPGGFSDEGIYVMNADGAGLRRILSLDRDLKDPVQVGGFAIHWSPDGTRIAFIRYDRTDRSSEGQWIQQLMVMNADGSNLRALTQPEDGQVHSFSWSPDGTRIAFTRQFLETQQLFGYDLYVMPADGGTPVALTHDGRSLEPAWSPDGSRIAFVSRKPAQEFRRNGIYVMNADGTDVTRLTTVGTPDDSPAWSADGSAIAFVRYLDDEPGHCLLMVMQPDGTGQREVLQGKQVSGCFGSVDW